MKKFYLLLASVFVFGACHHETIDERAERECREFTTSNCPVNIAAGIDLDSIVFERSSRTVCYFYSHSIDIDTTATSLSRNRADLLSGIKNSPELLRYKQEGYNFRYTYFSKTDGSRRPIDFRFTPNDYNK